MARLAVIADGAGVHSVRWIEALRSTNHDLIWLATRRVEKPPDGVRVFELGEVSGSLAKRQLGLWKNVAAVRSLLAQHRVDLVQAQFLTPCGWYAWASGRPFMQHLWGSDILRIADMPAHYRWMSKQALGHALTVTADSSNLLDAAQRLCPAMRRGPVVSFGVDTQKFAPLDERDRAAVRKRFGINTVRFIVFARNFSPSMNVVSLVRAFAMLPLQVADGWSLVLKKGFPLDTSSEDVLKVVSEASLGHRVRVIERELGYDEMAALYGAADVFVSVPTPGFDGLAQSLLDAAASGCALVVSANPDTLEVFGEKRLAGSVVTDPSSPMAIARTLQVAMSVEARAVTAANRRYIQEEYERSICIARVAELTETSVAASPVGGRPRAFGSLVRSPLRRAAGRVPK